MREIKFRAFEKFLNEMIPVFNIDFEKKIINKGGAWRLFNEIEIMQYTGLKDKNGVGIYEGDILKTNYTSLYGTYYKGVLKFGEYHQDGSGGEYNPSKCLGFYIEAVNPRENDSKNHLIVFEYMKTSSPFEFESLEVIGNIYENPELLEESK